MELRCVSLRDNHVSLSFHIIVAYGVSISAVTDNLDQQCEVSCGRVFRNAGR